jgi:cell division protein FtsI/penicillin-binding protein 2
MPPGLRLYGKTGTADMIGLKDEVPFGVKFNEWGSPNSWFLGIGETAEGPSCQARGPRRIVVAVVVPRGGLGARTAGPAAMEIMNALQQLEYLPKPKPPAPGQAAASAAPPGPAAAPAPAPPVPAPGGTGTGGR